MNHSAAHLRSSHFTSFSLHVLIYRMEIPNHQLSAAITCLGPCTEFSINIPFPSISFGFAGLYFRPLPDSPSPLLFNSVNVASSDLSHNLPQSHLPPKLAKRLMREAGTLRSRERSLSWKMGRRSEDGKVGTVPRKSKQTATTLLPKLGGQLP